MVDVTGAPNTQRLEAALQNALVQPVAVVQLQRLTAGATKQTWLLDATVRGTPERFVLQTLPPDKLQSSEGAAQRTLSPKQDAQIAQLAREHGVPAPELVLQLDGSQNLGHGQITRYVAGETLAARILRDARYTKARHCLTEQCAQALANTHRMPANKMSFLPTKDTAAQWQDMREQVYASGICHPALEWGLRWIEERLADHTHPAPSPVHGDFRLGNFIVNDAGLAAVIDWELAHLGDPMQDLAWLCLRTWRFGGAGEVAGIGQRHELYAAYERYGGLAVNQARVFFWDMACQMRWAVMCLGMGQGAPGLNPVGVSLEHRLIGRRMAEPLFDMVQLAKTRGDAA